MLQNIGRQLLIGIQGTVLDATLAVFLKVVRPSGIIFFSRNIESYSQFKKLIEDIQSLLGEDVFFALDHEGGLVQRLAEPLTSFPGNYALGKTGREDWAYEQGAIFAEELKDLGIHVNLAPVLDVLTPELNPGITIRSLGQDHDLVARLGSAMIRGMEEHGLGSTAKHFPGKGASTVDAHEDLPFVGCSASEMDSIHLMPFRRAIESGVSFVMTSHVVYTKLDTEGPATFSRKIVTELLREKMSFKGVIFSDDMEMGAIVRKFSFEEAVVRCVEAGHDIVLICHQSDLIKRGLFALESAYRQGRLKIDSLEKSISRLQDVLKRMRALKPRVALRDGRELEQDIAEASIEIIRSGQFSFKKKGVDKLILFVPDFSELSSRYYFESSLSGTESIFRKAFLEHELKADEIRVSPEHGLKSKTLDDYPFDCPVVFFCFDATRQTAERKVLMDVQKKFMNCAVVLIRNPFDLQYVVEGVTCIQTYGFRTAQIRRAIDLLFRM